MTTLKGTGALIRLILRRDRIRLPVWLVLLTLLPVITASAFIELFATEASRAAYVAGIESNPAIRAIQGPVFGSSVGAVTAARVLGFAAVLVALMSLLTVVRHTRAEEEAGRRELLGATVVGRQAPLTAALIVVLGANLVLVGLTVGGLVGLGLPVTGSVALGLALVSAGWAFAGIAAVTAQLTETARTASGLALAALGGSYLLRAVGDSSNATWLSWLSPLGWPPLSRPFVDERWWVLGLAAGFTVVLIAVAYALQARRDLAEGVLPPRPGPATASPALGSAFGLAYRLQRGILLAWTLGFAVLGAVYGSVAQGVEQLLDSPQLRELIAQLGGSGTLVDTFLAAQLGALGLIASGYAIQATLRMRAEEVAQRAEPVLATAVGRVRWAVSHLVFALLGPAVALAAAGLAAGLLHGLRVGDVAGQLPRVLAGALVQLPAVLVLAGIAMALFGLLPRYTALAWAALVACLMLGQIGELLQLDQWALDLSPFTHQPSLPGGDVSAVPLVWLAAVAFGLVGAGLVGLRRRDIS